GPATRRRAPRGAPDRSQAFEELPKDTIRVEDVFRERSRCATVALVVVGYLVERGSRFVRSSERQQSRAGREPVREAGVLSHHRPPRGEVTDAAVAEPA